MWGGGVSLAPGRQRTLKISFKLKALQQVQKVAGQCGPILDHVVTIVFEELLVRFAIQPTQFRIPTSGVLVPVPTFSSFLPMLDIFIFSTCDNFNVRNMIVICNFQKAGF